MPSVKEKEMLASRKEAMLKAKQINARSIAEDRDLTNAEDQEIQGLLEQAEACEMKIDAGRRGIKKRDDWASTPQPLKTHPAGYDTSSPQFHAPATVDRGDGRSVADSLFGRKTDSGGFNSFGDFLLTLDSGRFDPRMVAANTIGIDSEGGFLVPEIFQNAFIDAVLERSIMASRCRLFPMTSNVLKVSSFDGNDHSGGTLFGGLLAAWEGEIPSLSEQSPKTRQITFNARKLLILTRASSEMTSDSPAYERMLGTALVEATAWQLDYALLRGTGSAQPLGATTADSRVVVAKESSQAATTIWYDNLLKMFSRLHPASYQTAIWVANPKCLPELFTLDVHESASALGSALISDTRYEPFKESNGTFTLFGRPCLISEKLPTLGQEGDIVLLDPQSYGLAVRQEIVVEKSTHAGFVSDSSYYRAKMRVDGQPLWGKVQTPQSGDTLSWCVTLAIRD